MLSPDDQINGGRRQMHVHIVEMNQYNITVHYIIELSNLHLALQAKLSNTVSN